MDEFGNWTTDIAPFDKPYDVPLLKRLEIAFLSLIFALAVVGNSCVVIVLLRRAKKLSRMNFFVMHLSVADLTVAFSSVLTQLLQNQLDPKGIVRIHNDFLCRVYHYVQLVPLFASTYMLVIIAIDRYKAICAPLSTYSWTRKRCYFMVAFAWLISALGSTPQLGIFHYDSENGRCNDVFATDVGAFKAYVVYLIVVLLIVPVTTLVTLYGIMSHTVWKTVTQRNKPDAEVARHQRDHPQQQSRDHQVASRNIIPRTHSRRGYSRAKIRTVVMTSVIVVAFIACWTPYWIGNGIWAFVPNIETGSEYTRMRVNGFE